MNTWETAEAKAAWAKINGRKGKEGMDCDRTQCQESPATWYNRGSYAWYCESCAAMINRANQTMSGQFWLCTLGKPK